MQVIRFMSGERKKAALAHRNVPLCAVNTISAADPKNAGSRKHAERRAKPVDEPCERHYKSILQMRCPMLSLFGSVLLGPSTARLALRCAS